MRTTTDGRGLLRPAVWRCPRLTTTIGLRLPTMATVDEIDTFSQDRDAYGELTGDVTEPGPVLVTIDCCMAMAST
jgi:hypothetical protein